MFDLFKAWGEDPVEEKLENLTAYKKPRATKYKPRRKKQTSRAESAQLLLTFISDHNGRKLSTEQMARGIKVSKGYIPVLLADLVKAGAIKRSGSRNHSQYFALRRKVNKQVRRKLPSIETVPSVAKKAPRGAEVKRKMILDFLTAHEGQLLTQTDIAVNLGIDKASTGHYIRGLKEDNLIAVGHPVAGFGKVYRVNPDIKVDTTPKHLPEDIRGKTFFDQREAEDAQLIAEFLQFYKSKRG